MSQNCGRNNEILNYSLRARIDKDRSVWAAKEFLQLDDVIEISMHGVLKLNGNNFFKDAALYSTMQIWKLI